MFEVDVISTAISHIKYDEDIELLTITFHSGGSYDYPGVPQSEVKALAAAPSVGKYFHQHIKQYGVRK